nr:leucoanthocyantin reductase [Paeonia delavayi]
MTLSTRVSGSKGRILIAGATGFIGNFIAEASLEAGRPTYILVRRSDSGSKAKAIQALRVKGAIIVYGSLNEQELLEKILKEEEIDVVVAAVGGANILDQLTLVKAIEAVGTIKRYLPSEFGHDVDRANPVEPGLSMYKEKRRVRRLIEDSGVPYTYICCNSIASWPYFDNTHPSQLLPPLDYFQIYGDGTVKAYFVAGTDIGKFTIKATSDCRTLNKCVHFRPSCNLLNMNELACLWEKKIGRTLPRQTITEDHLLAIARENSIPKSIVTSFTHDIFIKGCQINFSIDDAHDVEVTSLYPDETFRTMGECFDDFLVKINKQPPNGITSKSPPLDALTISDTCA